MLRRMTVLFSWLVLGGLILAGCGGGGGSTPGTGGVFGYVYVPVDGNKSAVRSVLMNRATAPAGYQPLANALVSITGTTNTTTTDANGYYSIQGIPIGQQTITVTKDGYLVSPIVVNVVANIVFAVPDTRMSKLTRKWTVMVYLDASNNLETDGLLNVKQMEQVGSTTDVDILVQMSRIQGYDSSNGNWSDTRRFRVVKSTDPTVITSPVLADLGQLDMGKASTLQDFIRWSQTNYPANHYLLVLWDHGAGWRNRSRTAPLPRGIVFDDRFNSFINIWDLPAALQITPKLDLVAFDACFMQMLEIAYELRNSCSITVGSEASPPEQGYPYQTWLGDLVANASMTPSQLASKIVHDTIDNMGSQFDLAQSALDMSKISTLATAVDQLAQALIAHGAAYTVQLASARDSSQDFDSSVYYKTYKDLYDYTRLIVANVPDSMIQSAARAVQTALAPVVIDQAYSGSSLSNSHGVSLFVPNPSLYDSTYANLAFSQATQWPNWLRQQQQ